MGELGRKFRVMQKKSRPDNQAASFVLDERVES
jgi:hypothetical protein